MSLYHLKESFFNGPLFNKQKYHDFIEVADEAISEFTKDVDGKKVAMWPREEIEEIVKGQVKQKFQCPGSCVAQTMPKLAIA